MNILRLHEERVRAKAPTFKGKMVCPYCLPHRPKSKTLWEWVSTTCPDTSKDYLRRLYTWTKANKQLAWPGALQWLDEVDRRTAERKEANEP